MAAIFKFETNIPKDLILARKRGDWFGERQESTWDNKPTVQYKYRAEIDGVDSIFYATEMFHEIIRKSGANPGESVRITKLDKDWKVETATGVTTKANLSLSPPIIPPIPEGPAGLAMTEVLPPPPAAPIQTHFPGPMTFNDVVCLAWKAHTAAYRILDVSGLDFSAAEVNSLCAQVFIRSEKEKCRPTTEDMEKFVAAIKETPRGGDAIGDGGYLALKAIAAKIGVPECDLVARMGGIYMKQMKTDKYPSNPREFPLSLVPEVETYLDAMQKVGPLA